MLIIRPSLLTQILVIYFSLKSVSPEGYKGRKFQIYLSSSQIPTICYACFSLIHPQLNAIPSVNHQNRSFPNKNKMNMTSLSQVQLGGFGGAIIVVYHCYQPTTQHPISESFCSFPNDSIAGHGSCAYLYVSLRCSSLIFETFIDTTQQQCAHSGPIVIFYH